MSNGVTESVSTAIDCDRLSGAKLSAWIKSPERSASELAAFEGRSTALDRLIASHECASTETLSRLSHSSDRATRSRVCKNPNTPTAEYLRLGQQFPVEFLANPILDFLLLENPALLKEASSSLLIRLLKSKQCPEAFLVWAASHPEEKVQLAVAMNPSLPHRAIDPLKASANPRVREAAEATELGDLTPEKAEQAFVQAVKQRISEVDSRRSWKEKDIGLVHWPLLSLGAKLDIQGLWAEFFDAPPDLLKHLVNDPVAFARYLVADYSPDAQVLAHLAEDKVEYVRSAVVQNPNVSAATLAILATDRSDDVRALVARHENVSEQSLASLAEDPIDEVRSHVARNVKLSPKVLEILANDPIHYVRSKVADHAHTPKLVLARLAVDKDENVRKSVASNPNTSADILETLSTDQTSNVRCLVANHRQTSQQVLLLLAQDKDENVRKSVAFNSWTKLNSRTPLTNESDEGDTTSVALKSDFFSSAESLLLRSQDRDERVRLSAIENSTPPEILETLSKDSSDLIRRAVADHVETPSRVLTILSEDRIKNIRLSVAQNSNTPHQTLRILGSDSDEDIRSTVASNHSSSAEVLALLAEDPDHDVRSSVARNPNTPSQVLEKLSFDRDNRVVFSAIANPRWSGTPVIEVLHRLTGPQSLWYQRKFRKASPEERAAIERNDFFFFVGKDPNRSVLARRPLASIMALCAGPYIEPSRIAKVVSSSDWLVRAAVARNRGTPENLLKRLASDTHPMVRALTRRPAIRRENVASPLTGLNHKRILCELAIRESKKGEIPTFLNDPLLAALVADSLSWEIMKNGSNALRNIKCRQSIKTLVEFLPFDNDTFNRLYNVPFFLNSISINPHTPSETLRRLAKHDQWKTRMLVAVHGNVPEDLLEELQADSEGWVASKALLHANERLLSKEIRLVKADKLVDSTPEIGPAVILNALIQCGYTYPEAEGQSLAQASRKMDWLNRLAVALHPKTNSGTLAFLEQDVDIDVSQAARLPRIDNLIIDTWTSNIDHWKTRKYSVTFVTPCPACGQTVIESESRCRCKACDFSMSLTPGNRALSLVELEALLANRVVGPLKGFRSGRGGKFSAILRLDKDHRLTFDFGHGQDEDEDENDPSLLPHIGSCPKCTGRVLEQGLAYACEQNLTLPKQCDFRLGKVILQQPISTEQMQKLLLEGKTDLLQDFVSSKTRRKFRAYLTLDPQGKVGFEFAPRADKS